MRKINLTLYPPNSEPVVYADVDPHSMKEVSGVLMFKSGGLQITAAGMAFLAVDPLDAVIV